MLYSELKYLWKVFVCSMKRPAHLISSCNPVLYREKCIFLVPFVWLVMSVRLGKRESECSCGWSSGYTVWIMAWIKTSTQYSSSCVASQLLGKSERWICRKWQMEQFFFFLSLKSCYVKRSIVKDKLTSIILSYLKNARLTSLLWRFT